MFLSPGNTGKKSKFKAATNGQRNIASENNMKFVTAASCSVRRCVSQKISSSRYCDEVVMSGDLRTQCTAESELLKLSLGAHSPHPPNPHPTPAPVRRWFPTWAGSWLVRWTENCSRPPFVGLSSQCHLFLIPTPLSQVGSEPQGEGILALEANELICPSRQLRVHE